MPAHPDPTLGVDFEDALVFALRSHADQARKGTSVPYFAHLMAVTAIVLEHGGTEVQAMAALLHDAVEDQGGADMMARIRERFGDDVAEIVDGCTDADTVPKPPWRARKEAYVEHVRHASEQVRLVSMADKLHNASAILRDYRMLGDALWDRFTATAAETLWYYRALVEAFRGTVHEGLLRELEEVVGDLESEVRGD